MNNPVSLQSVIDSVEALSPDDQDLLIELIQKRRIEQRRADIARNAATTLAALKAVTARQGTLADLKVELLSDYEYDY
jgi:hypothetical protein